MNEKIFISIGSNIEAKKNISFALKKLTLIIDSIKVSPSYITSPWGGVPQDNFMNLVISGYYSKKPLGLLEECQKIENQCKRERSLKNGPRTLDLDILLFGSQIINLPSLAVPHPGLYERDFMLVPLLDISPQVLDPISKKPFLSMKDEVKFFNIIDEC